ncbi:MAG: site-specific DNA-methyltransferase [Candidatus Saccharibacteria bacterium]|nr:site-specific DNA-methyltransferase [Candidatus Saccharibacteria bacterium]
MKISRPTHKDIPRNTIAIGDNLQYLQQLVNSSIYFDVIYIDPPYNTGNHFSYNDKRTASDWIAFITKRLTLASDILKEDGVIFISIDDSSLYELKIACDEIFSKSNSLGVFITKQATRSNSKHINTIHEYVIAYAKNKKKLPPFQIRRVNSPADAQMIHDISRRVKREFEARGKRAAEQLLATINAEYMAKKNIAWLRNYSMVDDRGDVFFLRTYPFLASLLRWLSKR